MRIRFALVIFILAASTAAPQGQSTTGITGFVKDPQGRAIRGAQLQLYRQSARAASTTLSSDAGAFRFENLEAGTFFLEAGQQGFQTATLTVEVKRGAMRDVNIMLQLAGVSQRVIVTAADQAQTAAEVSKAVSVISHDEIMNRNVIALSETLSTIPGVTIRNQGGPGQYTSMSIRGLRSAAGAVLIDGMRFRDASTSQGDATALFAELNFINTDHVELLRGSGSSLYGTDAIGGAVNIVSDPGGGPVHGDLQAEGGTLGLFRGRGSIAGGALGDRFKYSAGILHLNVTAGVDGQDANRSSGIQGFGRYDFTPKLSLSGRFWGSDDFVQVNNAPTSSGIPVSNIPATVEVPAVPLTPGGVRTLLAGGTPDFGNATYIPDVNDPDSRVSSRFGNAAFIFRDLLTPAASWQASYQLVHTQRIYENGPLGVGFQPAALSFSQYIGTIHTAELRGTAQVASWLNLTAGYEFEREDYFDHQDNHLPPPSLIAERTRIAQNANSGFFAAQLAFLERRLQVSLSGRAQTFSLTTPRFEYAGSENPYAGIHVNAPKALTGDVSFAYLALANTKIRAHFGNSYRAPSLYERFGAGFYNDFLTGAVVFSPYGDPRLAPDRYNSVDGGIDQYLFGGRVELSGTFFYTRIAQLIAFDSNGGINPSADPFGRSSGYLNGAGGISRGVELSMQAHPVSSLTFYTSYAYTNAGNDQDSIVPGFFHAFDVPRHTVSAVVTKSWTRRLATTFDYFHYSSYYDPYIGYLQAYLSPGYGQANLTGSYRFWTTGERAARIYAKVGNLFDRTYYVSGNLAPRTTFVAGLGYSF